jgi:hypothetical protein
MNRTQLQQEIEKTQKQLNRLQEQLNKSFPTLQEANPGDTLEDGTIVIAKDDGLVLIADTYYWSSTEASSTGACGMFFDNGIQNAGSKTDSTCVRDFRFVHKHC